jgi:hypothetical protein
LVSAAMVFSGTASATKVSSFFSAFLTDFLSAFSLMLIIST